MGGGTDGGDQRKNKKTADEKTQRKDGFEETYLRMLAGHESGRARRRHDEKEHHGAPGLANRDNGKHMRNRENEKWAQLTGGCSKSLFIRAAPNVGVGILRASSWWPTPRRHRQHCFFLGKTKPRGNFNFRSSSLQSSVTNHNLHNQFATTLEVTNTLLCASLAPSRALCSSVSQGSRCAPPGASSCSIMWFSRQARVVIVTWCHSVKSTYFLGRHLVDHWGVMQLSAPGVWRGLFFFRKNRGADPQQNVWCFFLCFC